MADAGPRGAECAFPRAHPLQKHGVVTFLKDRPREWVSVVAM